MLLASKSRGTLRGRMLDDGDAVIEIDIPEGAVGQATEAAYSASDLVVRPHLDAAEYIDEPFGRSHIRRYTRAAVRAFVVSATDQRDGWPDPELVAHAAPASCTSILSASYATGPPPRKSITSFRTMPTAHRAAAGAAVDEFLI